jgi:hypothetical protein
MTEIDRRALVTMAGAGLLLAGCDSLGGDRRDKKCPKPAGPVGECEIHGDKVTKKGKDEHGDVSIGMLCAVYIRFPTNGGGLTAIHNYVELSEPQSDSQLRSLAQKMFEEIKGENHDLEYYKQRENFEKLSFDRPTLIAFCVDNNEDFVKFAWDDTLGDEQNLEHLIRFTPYSGHKGYKAQGEEYYKKRKPNKNFYDIDRWIMSNPKNLESATVINIKYYNKTESHQNIPEPNKNDAATWHVYSMNIHLLMSGTSSAKRIPIVLDPDTGNMGSEP